MTSVLRAASTMSVTELRPLIFRIRSIWTNRRWTRRKLPLVIRTITATAWASVKIGLVEPEFAPAARKDERQLLVAQGSVLVRKPDPAVELQATSHALSMPGIPIRIGPIHDGRTGRAHTRMLRLRGAPPRR